MHKRMTNWDDLREELLQDPEFAREYERAGWRMDIAIQICRLRDEEGMTLEEVAEKAHVSASELRRLEEAEEDEPNLSSVGRIARALGASLLIEVVRERDATTTAERVKVA